MVGFTITDRPILKNRRIECWCIDGDTSLTWSSEDGIKNSWRITCPVTVAVDNIHLQATAGFDEELAHADLDLLSLTGAGSFFCFLNSISGMTTAHGSPSLYAAFGTS
jgi:hypothetical protein